MTGPAEFTYRRVHRASRELLFDCLTQPGHLTRFWGPAVTSTPIDGITVDLRPGGVFETTMVGDDDGGGSYAMRAVYVEVRRPEKLAWIEPGPGGGMTTTITLTELGEGRTEVVTRLANAPAMLATPEGRKGFLTSLDRFGGYVTALTGRA